ncbi:MAG TPA: FtsX-like permease family protein [Thermoplasmata archaeon]|nr:FtsX-like permease family protein [Thermoplasmata archaeon]
MGRGTILTSRRAFVGLLLCAILLGTTWPTLAALPGLPARVLGQGAVVITQGSGPLSVNESLVENLTAQSWVEALSAEILAIGTVRGQPVIVRAALPDAFLAIEGGRFLEAPGAVGGTIAGAGLAGRLGLEVGEFVSLVGSTSPRIEVTRIAGTFEAPGAADDELVVDFRLGRSLTGVGTSSYHTVRLRTSDPDALVAFLDGSTGSFHVARPDGSRVDVRSDPPSEGDRLTNLILRTGLGTLPVDALTTAIADATNSIRVVATGLALLIGSMVATVVHAVQARAFADKSSSVGVLRAVGASNGWMRARLVGESLLLGVAAGTSGAVLSIALGLTVRPLSPLVLFGHVVRPALDLGTLSAIVVATCAASVASGLLLLERSLRERPSDTLREGIPRPVSPALEVVLRG